jgi:aspartate/methionine/tyrosine aminotransferase
MDKEFCTFDLEHYQSQYERIVDYNLADSSVKCVVTNEWLDENERIALLETGLFYPEVNGTVELRTEISGLYANSDASNVLVTVGASQANSLVCQTMVKPGDHVVVMTPSYRQVWGTAHNMGCVVRELQLREDTGWKFDLDVLDSLITSDVKLVSIVNPNNPTGTVLTSDEMEKIVGLCKKHQVWLHADEVYHGTEHPGVQAASTFWGMYDKVIVTNSLSKAYGLSGLRIGWAVAPCDVIERLWRRHEYAVIAAAAPSMTLAEIALKPSKRAKLLERQRGITKTGLEVLHGWLAAHSRLFSLVPTQATSIVLLRCKIPLSSMQIAEAIRTRASVLVAPGSTLGAESHIRVTVGYEPEKVREALKRIAAVVESLARETESEPAAVVEASESATP